VEAVGSRAASCLWREQLTLHVTSGAELSFDWLTDVRTQNVEL
jgi:hypothetical protein